MGKKHQDEKVTIEIRRHPIHSTHWAGTIETEQGLVYTCTWAGDEPPSEEKVLEAWRTDKKAFNPGYY